jgi:hypothetical protein
MSEQERQESMDNLLRGAMASEDVPRLSSSFDRVLTQRLSPARLKPAARLVLIVYAMIAILISVWALRSTPVSAGLYFGLVLAAIAVVVPVSYAWMVNHPPQSSVKSLTKS